MPRCSSCEFCTIKLKNDTDRIIDFCRVKPSLFIEPRGFCDKKKTFISDIPLFEIKSCLDYSSPIDYSYIAPLIENFEQKQEQSVSTKNSSDIINGDCCYTCVFGLSLSEEGKRMCIANNRSEVEPYNVCNKYQRSSKYKKEKKLNEW